VNASKIEKRRENCVATADDEQGTHAAGSKRSRRLRVVALHCMHAYCGRRGIRTEMEAGGTAHMLHEVLVEMHMHARHVSPDLIYLYEP